MCGLLIGSNLLPAEEVRSVYNRWQAEAGARSSDEAQFAHWLVNNQVVTEYQAALLAKGYSEGYFINQYKILHRLGRGRSAGVYKAVHNLGQMVAIKVLPPSRSKDPQLLARFQREARLAVKLDHPNVVRSYQIGDYKGLHFLVMEYLDGETLEAVLQRRKQLPLHEAVRLTYQALKGLQHIHEKGLVHRDLKPANFMLVPAARREADTTLDSTLKILDIGLGRLLGDEGNSPDEALTTEGALLGTPDYLAPEQARDARNIDIRADIYSIGCVLFHMLTGQSPFPDKNILSQMVRHATETPKPLRDFGITGAEHLQKLLNTMLAKDPSQRYATPRKACHALRPLLPKLAPVVRADESPPNLKKYLTWLEANPESSSAEMPALGRPVDVTPVRATIKTHAGPAVSGASPSQVDVELVGQPAPASAGAAAPANRRFSLSNRDWLFLALGAGAVTVVGTLGCTMAWLMRP
jgi:eukaryotic-like serine/threonine-protein kinase